MVLYDYFNHKCHVNQFFTYFVISKSTIYFVKSKSTIKKRPWNEIKKIIILVLYNSRNRKIVHDASVEKDLSLINHEKKWNSPKCRFLRLEIRFHMLVRLVRIRNWFLVKHQPWHNCFTIPNLMTNHHIYITFTKRLVSIGEQEWRKRWWGRWRVKFPMSYR